MKKINKRQYKTVLAVLILTLMIASAFGSAVTTNDCKKKFNDTNYGSVARNDNHPPYQPSDPYPENGSTNVDINVDLSWSGGDPDGDPVTYDVYFGTTSPPPIVESNQSNTTYDPGTLDFETTYYWKIIAWDNQSAFNESLIWEFTTQSNTPPDLKKLDDDNPHWWCPSAENYELRLVAIDFEVDNISYWVEWGDGHNTGWLGPFSSGEQVTVNHAYHAQAIYTINVKAKDIHGAESDWELLDLNISELELGKTWLFVLTPDLRSCGDCYWVRNEMGFRLSLNPPRVGPIPPGAEIVISQDHTLGLIIDFHPYLDYWILVGRFNACIVWEPEE